MAPVPQPTEPPGFVAEATGSDALWKALTQQGNAARAQGDAAAARALYEAALAEAERVFETAQGELMPDAAALAPVLYNISCSNLAQHRRELGDAAGALAALERAFERLAQTAGDPPATSAPDAVTAVTAGATAAPRELRLSSAKHLQLAAAAFIEALVEQGERERAEACVRRANAAISAAVELARTSAQPRGKHT